MTKTKYYGIISRLWRSPGEMKKLQKCHKNAVTNACGGVFLFYPQRPSMTMITQ